MSGWHTLKDALTGARHESSVIAAAIEAGELAARVAPVCLRCGETLTPDAAGVPVPCNCETDEDET